jgi:hypothetical protein
LNDLAAQVAQADRLLKQRSYQEAIQILTGVLELERTSCHFTTSNKHLQFASDLHTRGRYYLDYRRLMDHWKTVLTVPMLEIDYESLVTDTEPTISRLVQFCGVAWEPGCAQFHETARGVLTPSRWQVRQPIYRHAVGRWRNYEKHLTPLLDILKS